MSGRSAPSSISTAARTSPSASSSRPPSAHTTRDERDAAAIGEYAARRGIELIGPADGVECLLTELATGTDTQVVYMCADPAAFEAGTFEVGAARDGQDG
jgi:hypothetical protein